MVKFSAKNGSFLMIFSGQTLMGSEKFESIDAISEGNMPSWYRFQRFVDGEV
jgi:hypothetical protein